MRQSSLRDKILAYADCLARSHEDIPAAGVAWRLRVIAGVLCSYGDGCKAAPWPGYTMCERHVSQSALEDSWAPSGVQDAANAAPSEASPE